MPPARTSPASAPRQMRQSETASARTNGHASRRCRGTNRYASADNRLHRRCEAGAGHRRRHDQRQDRVDRRRAERADFAGYAGPVRHAERRVKDVDGPVHPNFPLMLKMAQARVAGRPSRQHPPLRARQARVRRQHASSSPARRRCHDMPQARRGHAGSGSHAREPQACRAVVRYRGRAEKLAFQSVRPPRTAPLDLARSAHVFTHPSVFRALGYRSLEHEFYPRGWNGDWAFRDHGLHVRTAAESYRQLLRPGSDVLFVPPVHVGDLYLSQPATWLRTMIAQHGGVQLEAA